MVQVFSSLRRFLRVVCHSTGVGRVVGFEWPSIKARLKRFWISFGRMDISGAKTGILTPDFFIMKGKSPLRMLSEG